MTTREEFDTWANKSGLYLSDRGMYLRVWQACDELNKARIADLEIVVDYQKELSYIKNEELARLELENKTLRDLLREARDDVANQLQEYQSLLPYKQHRYDAQKITLDDIDKALATTKDKP